MYIRYTRYLHITFSLSNTERIPAAIHLGSKACSAEDTSLRPGPMSSGCDPPLLDDDSSWMKIYPSYNGDYNNPIEESMIKNQKSRHSHWRKWH